MMHSKTSQTHIAPMLLLVISAVVVLTVMTALFAVDTFIAHAEEVVAPKTVTAQELNEDNVGKVNVRTIEVTEAGKEKKIHSVAADSKKGYVLYKDEYMGFSPIENLFGYYNRTTIIEFSGVTQPGAAVTLLIDSKIPTSLIVTADDAGKWTLNLNIDDLKPGDYNATIKTAVGSVASDTIVVGKFSVGTVQLMSNTMWMVLVIGGAGIILLLVIVNILVLTRHRVQRHKYKK